MVVEDLTDGEHLSRFSLDYINFHLRTFVSGIEDGTFCTPSMVFAY